jgi:hypothetical protein
MQDLSPFRELALRNLVSVHLAQFVLFDRPAASVDTAG